MFPVLTAEWRNRQTRRIQNPVMATSCRFDPGLGYYSDYDDFR